jgi:hypothetical protein
VAAVDFTVVAVDFTVVAVASMAEWVGFTEGALLAQDFAEAAGEDTVEATSQGTALVSGLAFPATGLITVPDGVILTTVILIIILTRLIQTQFLIRIHIMATGMYTPDPIKPTAQRQMGGRFI